MRKGIQRFIIFQILLFLFVQKDFGQKGKLTGIIYGEEGSLHGASVSVGPVNTFSNSAGRFSCSLDAGNYMLTITHVGYTTVTQEIKISPGDTLLMNFVMVPDEKVGEPVVLGSRVAAGHSNLLSPVPVDVLTSRQLQQTAQTGLTQMLQFTVPSLNTSRPLVNEPATLRGLDPDQVLILVDGKRYHNMSFLNFGGVRGILGRGTVANDLNSIPFSAIEKIEILKDGASAQYGSDAISGVINIRLRKSINKISAQLHTGQSYKGDGKTMTAEINYGVSINKKGFLNFSGSYRFQDPTYRGGIYNGTVYTNNIPADNDSIQERNFDRNKPSNAGTSKQNGYSLLINGGNELGKRNELFWTAGFNHRTTIFTTGYIFPKNASRINPELFPDGIKARPSNHSNDVWSIVGIRGYTKNNLKWEYSSTYGTNFAKYHNKETNNASQYFALGINAPTTFYTGALIYGQFINSIEGSQKFRTQTQHNLNLGFGAEWRSEYFQIKGGEDASWNNYDPRKLGGSGGLVFSPTDEVKATRDVLASYLDLESEYNQRLLVNLSTRYEYYTDFGSNLAGKLALRYKITEKLSIRSSVSNGFRAPGLQQRYYSLTRLGTPNSNGELPTWGIFRNNSAVANALRIPSLTAERSLNFSGGFVAHFNNRISLAADAYWIRIKDRIVLSGTFDRTNPDVDSLLRGITNVDQVQFFTNAIDTKTKGIDLLLNGKWKLNNACLVASLAANITQTRLYGKIKTAGNLKDDAPNSNTLFNTEEKTKLEKGQPSDKIILSLTYNFGRTNMAIRNTRFGKTAISPAYFDQASRITSFVHESFSGKVLTDISVGYSFKKCLTITFGVNNLFNVYPDRLKDYRNTSEGQYIYAQEATPFGFNGGYYFLSISIIN